MAKYLPLMMKADPRFIFLLRDSANRLVGYHFAIRNILCQNRLELVQKTEPYSPAHRSISCAMRTAGRIRNFLHVWPGLAFGEGVHSDGHDGVFGHDVLQRHRYRSRPENPPPRGGGNRRDHLFGTLGCASRDMDLARRHHHDVRVSHDLLPSRRLSYAGIAIAAYRLCGVHHASHYFLA